MNYSLKQLVLPVFILIPFLSAEAVGDECTPTGSTGTAGMSLTTCPDEPTFEVDWPEDFDLKAQLPFQIRSCGDYGCNRATKLSIHTYRPDWDQQKINLVNGISKIPLTVEVKQIKTPQPIRLPIGYNQIAGCLDNSNNCQFLGSGLTNYPNNDDCPDCVYFELHLEENLNDLITAGSIKNSGSHKASFWLGIQQHKESSNTGSGDSGHHAWVRITISLNVPDLIQISGLNDMELSNKNLVGEFYEKTQEFCVYTLLGQKFTIKASGTADTAKDFRLVNNNKSYKIPYEMLIGRTEGFPPVQIQPNNKLMEGEDWVGDCPPRGDNSNGDTNMTLKIRVDETEAGRQPSGVYKDTMTITVKPE